MAKPFDIKITTPRGGFKQLDIVSKRLREVGDRLDAVLLGTAKDIEGDARESILRGPARTGKHYRRKQGRIHVASAEGEPPKSDTGQLAGSIHSERVLKGVAVVGSLVKHGAELEEKMKRPWLQPAVDKNMPGLERRLRKLIGDV